MSLSQPVLNQSTASHPISLRTILILRSYKVYVLQVVSVTQIFLPKHCKIIPRLRSSGFNVFRPETEHI